MRTGAVIILLSVTALTAYSLGRQDAPSREPPPAATAVSRPSTYPAKPVSLVTASVDGPALPPSSKPSQSAPPAATDKRVQPEIKPKVEEALTAAAIAAIRAEIAITGRATPARALRI
jgi:hypothetical protein